MKIGQEQKTAEELKAKERFEAAKKILGVPGHKPLADLLRNLLPSQRFLDEKRFHARSLYAYCEMNFKQCLIVKLVRVFAADPPYEDAIREIVIRRLEFLLSNHGERGEASLEIIVIEEIAPYLISCLEDEATPEDTFMILAEVVSYVAYDYCICHEYDWNELYDYICDTVVIDFQRAIYVFKKLPLPLDQDEFVMPVVENLFPEIVHWLVPWHSQRPTQIVNNWPAAFAGAFCLAIHLMESERVDLAGNLVDRMLKSVMELVRNRKELQFVRSALFQVEKLVMKQVSMYCVAEYRFVLGLMRRITGIEGLRKELKTVIWRIWATLKKNTVSSSIKEQAEIDDWLNLIPD